VNDFSSLSIQGIKTRASVLLPTLRYYFGRLFRQTVAKILGFEKELKYLVRKQFISETKQF